MKPVSRVCLALVLSCATGVQAEDSWGDKLSTMVTDGKASVDFRYRYEGVDDSGFDKDARASTLRSRLTLETAKLNGFSALLEMDDVRTLGADDYNSTVNGKTEYPVVADPVGTDLNQFWFRYGNEAFDGTLGRQRILHGNQRFIGGVAWRQNEQTFDGVRALGLIGGKLNLDFSYVNQVNRIFGPDDGANPAELKGDNVLFRADYQLAETHQLNGYIYVLDFDPQSGYASGKTVDNSSNTYGIEYSGKFDRISVDAALARQTDTGNSTLDYDASYYLAELGFDFKTIKLNAGYEVLAADNGVGFSTPLATLHKFQGWADKFLSTPGDGVEDAYLGIHGQAGPVKLGAVYHQFEAESSSTRFGKEIDLVATWIVNKQFSLQAKYADFKSDDSSRFTDTQKGWVTLQLKI